MPRFAATILGLVLVAFSIGFNTVRYPVVWEMVNPARANETVQPATVTQPAEPESLAPAPPVPASPPPEPAKPIEVTPTPEVKAAPEVTDKTVDGNTQVGEGGTSDGDAAAKSEEAVEAELAARKPLVPVTVVSTPSVPGDEAGGGAGISRLPPVDQNDPNLASRNAQLSGGSIPIYPTTGIE
jgi:hypothetical protein